MLMLVFESKLVGETTGGVQGLPVHAQVITHLRCDACNVIYGSRHRGHHLTDYCRRRLQDCRNPETKPRACPCCPADKGKLVEVYLESPQDRFSVNPERYGSDCLLCARCGRLIWFRDHGAEHYQRLEAEFMRSLPREMT